VSHYLRIAPGARGVTFVTDAETGADTVAAFDSAGVPAALVTYKTPDAERVATVDRFRRGELRQLVNVDLFGEGFDLPAIEVCSMARPTCSYGLYVQQFGRALRPLDGKSRAVIIDHVGNVHRHGLPDSGRPWSLDARERTRTAPSDVVSVATCLECLSVYERALDACPYCGAVRPLPVGRRGPELVHGDLLELDAETLAAMRAAVDEVDLDAPAYRARQLARGARPEWAGRHVRHHVARQEAQATLRAVIAWWAGEQRATGRGDRESYRRFFDRYGVDVLSAQALDRAEALQLAERVSADLGGVTC
jgi:hypothetical protein